MYEPLELSLEAANLSSESAPRQAVIGQSPNSMSRIQATREHFISHHRLARYRGFSSEPKELSIVYSCLHASASVYEESYRVADRNPIPRI